MPVLPCININKVISVLAANSPASLVTSQWILFTQEFYCNFCWQKIFHEEQIYIPSFNGTLFLCLHETKPKQPPSFSV